MWHAAGGQIPVASAHFTLTGVISGELHSTYRNGGPIAEEEGFERPTEIRCPRCSRKTDPEESPEIRVGGRR
jgi:hypothetical protein